MNIPKQAQPVVRDTGAVSQLPGTSGVLHSGKAPAGEWKCEDIDAATLKCHKTGKWIVAHKLDHDDQVAG